MPIFAVEKANPYFTCLGDGYFGLAPTPSNEEFSLLGWMYEHEIIKKKAFGIHTHIYNSTQDPSKIRFGGYDKTLFPEGHEQIWFNTTT